MDWGAIAAIAVPTVTVIFMGGAAYRRLGSIGAKVSRIDGALAGLVTSHAETKTSLTDFRQLEEERHEKQDLQMDDMVGEMRRHGREIGELQRFEARVSERLKMPDPGGMHA